MDPARLIFIDESCAKTNMTRLYGRAHNGKRVWDSAPHGHWNATTMLGSLRLDGSNASMTLNGATDNIAFGVYIQQILAPTLRPGDKVIWDNLSAHRSGVARAAIEAVGAEILPLPPYSPDLNPIEKMWSKVKALLRGAKARTQEELHAAIGCALKAVTAEDAVGWFQSCGYTVVQS
jgi:transposase